MKSSICVFAPFSSEFSSSAAVSSSPSPHFRLRFRLRRHSPHSRLHPIFVFAPFSSSYSSSTAFSSSPDFRLQSPKAALNFKCFFVFVFDFKCRLDLDPCLPQQGRKKSAKPMGSLARGFFRRGSSRNKLTPTVPNWQEWSGVQPCCAKALPASRTALKTTRF